MLDAVLNSSTRRYISLIGLSALVSALVLYWQHWPSLQTLAWFNQHLADPLFLSAIILIVIWRLINENPTEQFSTAPQNQNEKYRLFWWFIGAAHFSWLISSLLQWLAFDWLAPATLDLVTDSGYFLYYCLIIIAIQVLEMKRLDDLLRKQMLSLWVANLVFLLGAYILLVLLPSAGGMGNSSVRLSAYVFYIVLDCYLIIRWAYIALKDFYRKQSRLYWFLIAAIGWLIADGMELLEHLNTLQFSSGQMSDWIWYVPFCAVIMACLFSMPNLFNSGQEIKLDDGTSAVNNPALLALLTLIIGSAWFMLIEKTDTNLLNANSTEAIVYLIWLITLLLLALEQILRLSKRHLWDQKQLATIHLSHEAALERMKQQQQDLEQASANYRLILETTINPIFTLDTEGLVLSCNPAAARMLGQSQRQIVGQQFVQFINPTDPFARFFEYRSWTEGLRKREQGLDLESKVIGSDGELVDVHVTVSMNRSSREEIIVISLADIRHQKLAERESEELKQAFTANISHEFRTPLSIIKGVIDNLKQKTLPDNASQQLAIAERNNQRLIHMVEQLLDFNRLSQRLNERYVFLASELFEAICMSFEPLAEQELLNLQWKSQPGVYLKGNAEALEKIMFNLLGNAMKYTPANGNVSVLLSSVDGQHAELVVEDTGVGMSEDQLPRIFDRFHRAHQTASTTHGVGIGLALVKQLADEMDWSIKVYSELGQGSRFVVTLPVATDEERNHAREVKVTEQKIRQHTSKFIQQESVQKSPALTHQSAKHSLLFIEDNADMQQQLQQIFAENYHCFSALNGDEGIRLALEYLPDLILCDVMMPGISGFQVLSSLKQNELTSHIPIIMLTALGDEQNKIRGLESKAEDYIAKPFAGEELKLKVNNLLLSRDSFKQKLASQWKSNSFAIDEAIENPFLSKMNKVMEKNYPRADFTLTEFASQMAVSERQLQRKVKALLDVSPAEALRQYRLKQARLELKEGAQAGLVAQMCGFSSQTYFGRCFKQEFGMTPKQFQQSLKKD